ncbi:MAG: DUF5615 family PIN-like protein, partial [Stellaceae bacterium]
RAGAAADGPVKFLIDNALSPVLAQVLRQNGYDAIHARDRGMQSATDEEIFRHAEDEGRIVVSADTDFGTLLAANRKSQPSVVLFREQQSRQPERQAALLLANLPTLQAA